MYMCFGQWIRTNLIYLCKPKLLIVHLDNVTCNRNYISRMILLHQCNQILLLLVILSSTRKLRMIFMYIILIKLLIYNDLQQILDEY